MMTKKKRDYVKPAMQVYDLPQQPKILAGSGGLDKNSPFYDGGDPLNS